MTYSYNLLDKPWIPATDMESKVRMYSLRSLLANADTLFDIQGDNPLETIAIYRLLLAILHRNFGPQNRDAWQELWQAGEWDMDILEEYFSRWHERFDLFHPKYPFYQAEDERVKPKSITLLIHGMVVNDTLFDHLSNDENITFSAEQAARTLLAAQCFGFGGACNPKYRLYFSDGSCTRGMLFLMQGDNLFQTLMLNLVLYTDESPPGLIIIDEDKPVWEMDDPWQAGHTLPTGYLDYLTWQNRRIMLHPEGDEKRPYVRVASVAPGLRVPEDIQDPLKYYKARQKKEGYSPLSFRVGRSLWRDSAALLQFLRQKNSDEVKPPYNLVWISQLVYYQILDASRQYRLIAGGMASEPGKPNVYFYRQEFLPIPLAYLKDKNLVEMLSKSLNAAEAVFKQLWGALFRLSTQLISPEADLSTGRQPDTIDVKNLISHLGVESVYWQSLEIPFYELMAALPQNPQNAYQEWLQVLQQTARDAFKNAEQIAGDNPRAMKAAVKADNQLWSGLRKVLSEINN